MELVVNGERRQVNPGLTVDVLVSSFEPASEGRGLAVAVDGEVVPRAEWGATPLGEGARVEIVAAVQGG
ncbi:MAG: sulfur carrier protein ThiS [Solirubrobacteraceae bacterium]